MATKTEDSKTADRPTLDERDHREGCPAERTETYQAVRPATAQRGARPVVVTRCIDCGGQAVKEA